MRTLHSLFLFLVLFAAVSAVNAQTEAATGFKPGAVILADGSRVQGQVKESIRSKAAVCLLKEGNEKKKCYEGSDLNGAEVEGTVYRCIRGDFFKVITTGEIEFLQKASDASGKPVYNGSEAVFSNGTDGKPGNYFLYKTETRELKLITKKNLETVAAASFAGCTAALDKAKTISNDIAALKEAVELFNNRSK